DVRHGHEQQAHYERPSGSEPVDEVADDEHEAVHADDVDADHREHVVLVVAAAHGDVAGEIHDSGHHREAGDCSHERGDHGGPAEDLGQRGGVRVVRPGHRIRGGELLRV